MGLTSSALGVVGFGVGIVIGLVVGFFFFIYFQSAEDKDPMLRTLYELDAKTMQNIIPHIPLWVRSPDYDRVDWFNKLVLYMWPYLDKAICNTIRSNMKPTFDQYGGKYMIKSIDFDHDMTLGTLPPTVHGVKAYEIQEKELVLEPAIRWAGNANITLCIKFLSLRLTLQLIELYISLMPRVTLKPLVPSFPCFAKVSVSLMEKPQVDFGFKIFGLDIMAIPGLYHFVQETISTQVSNLYHWPMSLEIPILDVSSGAAKKPVGILHVKVVRALNLLKMDFLGKSDPYVKLRLSGDRLPSKKTSVKMNNLNPEWNEQFKLIVKDPEMQVLEIHLYDWDKIKMHDKLGMQVVPLHLLTPHETKEFTLDLVKNLNRNDSHNKNRGKITLQLTFDPFKEESGSLSGMFDGNHCSTRSLSSNILFTGGVLSLILEAAEGVEGKYHKNPYAVIFFRGEKRTTKVIKRSINPRWNEEFQILLEDAPVDEKVHVQVVSKGKWFGFHSKEALGHVDISLSDVINNGHIKQRYHLIKSKNGAIDIVMNWKTI